MPVDTPDPLDRRRVVALTGASRGIGLATARALCAAGYTVVAGARDVRPLEAAGLGARLHAVPVDLTDGASVERFAAAVGTVVEGPAQRPAGCADGGTAEAAVRRENAGGGASAGEAGTGSGQLVALINNAGIGALGAGEEFPLDRAREAMETNLWGAARLVQLLLPLLRAGAAPQRPACLVNVGSLIAEYPVPFHALYAASKGALRAYTLALRGELAGHGVAVVLLEPGDIATGTTPLQHTAAGSRYADAFARVSAARAAKMADAPRPAAVARRLLRVLGQRRPPPSIACGAAAPGRRTPSAAARCRRGRAARRGPAAPGAGRRRRPRR
jgi:NAD(P)-dependent dehydrogenase (short-subunit alcohol dehydrogenase family)